ncbi:bifunctional 3,4-dihydroxy-2-butanone-4-phosphate synthase/GTP cyclohydrolase II [candidate division KSB1 bacterium]
MVENIKEDAEKMQLIEQAVEDYKQGKMLIIVDDEDRENEGDFVCAAEKTTPEVINFMSKYGRGIICLSMTNERANELGLNLMVENNTALHSTPFTVSIDAKDHTTTGTSAQDRAKTVAVSIDPATKPEDLARPGHIFPLRARRGGVLRRAGHTEATVDMAKLAGMYPAGVLCEILDEDGQMARMSRLKEIAKEHNMKIISIADLIKYRHRQEKLVDKIADVDFPSKFGMFKLMLFGNDIDDSHHLALVKGEIKPDEPVLVRVHSECLTGDALGSLRCDCGNQLLSAMSQIEKEGSGILLYMRQEGRGIGLSNKIMAYVLQDQGKDTVEANEALGFKPDLRDYGIGAQILHEIGVRKMKLLTNNPRKVIGLQGYGLEITERVAIEIAPNENNKKYLLTKKNKMGHMILEDITG